MKFRKLLSLFLCLAMCFSLVPAFGLTASAYEYSNWNVSTMEQLKSALEDPGAVNIVVTKDLKLETDKQFGNWCSIKGDKILDLKGHTVELKNKRLETSKNEETMFCVTGGSALLLKDTVGGGKIFHNGEIDGFGTSVIRNAFVVEKNATLTIDSGKIESGRYIKEYESLLARRVSKHIWGSGVIVSGGRLEVNGGTIEGSGNFTAYPIYCAAVKSTSADSLIVLNDGTFIGYNGSAALYGTGKGTWILCNGKFETAGTDDSFINGGGPFKRDAAPVGVTAEMIGNWAQLADTNKSPVFESTKMEVLLTNSAKLPEIPPAPAPNVGHYENINFIISRPVVGKTPSYTVKSGTAGVTLKDYTVTWYEGKRTMSETETFKANTAYSVTISSKELLSLNTLCDRFQINGLNAERTISEVESWLKTDFTRPDYETVNYQIEAPTVDKTPSTMVSSNIPGITLTNYTVVWHEGNTSGRTLSATETFKPNTVYSVSIYSDELIRAYSADDKYYLNGKLAAATFGDADTRIEYTFEKTPASGNPGETPTGFPFVDVKESDWFFQWVKAAHEMGLIDGVTPTTFVPNGELTYAQAITLAARMHQKYNTGKVTLQNGTNNWYDTYVVYCLSNLIIDNTYSSVINNKIDRQNYVHIFANALPDKALKAVNTIPDGSIPDVDSSIQYAKDIYKLYRAGILNGSKPDGTFNPTSNIKRSEVAAILVRMMDPDVRVGPPADLAH